MSEEFTIPARHGFDQHIPEWITEGVTPTEWELQEMRHSFRSADEQMRHAIKGLVRQLNTLHAEYDGQAGPTMRSAAGFVADAANHLGMLHQLADSSRHREAIARGDQ